MNEVTKLATCFRSAIEISEITNILPFFEFFPKNCCEHVSVFLGFYVSLKYPDLQIEIVRGKCETQSGIEYHLWLEINGQVFDLTLDQFEGYEVPIFGVAEHPMSSEFCEDKRDFIDSYMPYYYDRVLEIPRFSRGISSIVSKLKVTGWKYA